MAYIDFKTNLKCIWFAFKPETNLTFITHTSRAYRTNFDYVRRPNYQLVAPYIDMMEKTG